MNKIKIKRSRKPIKLAKKTTDKKRSKNDTTFAFTTPTVLGSMFLTELWGNHDIRIEDMIRELCTIQKDIVENNKTEYLELILLNQVHILNGIFMKLSAKSLQSEYLKQANIFMQLALNAQKQTRATITALANLKNPTSATFIKQQNNAVNQQVNNSTSKPQGLKNSEKISANELLSEVSHEKLDTRSESQAVCNDSPVATLENSRR